MSRDIEIRRAYARQIDGLNLDAAKARAKIKQQQKIIDGLKGALDFVADEVPTNWLDPLLSGPDKIEGLDNSGQCVEKLLHAVKKRIQLYAEKAIKESETTKDTTESDGAGRSEVAPAGQDNAKHAGETDAKQGRTVPEQDADHSWINQGVCCRKHDSRTFPGMIVCPHCGDKRCPRAEYCGNYCAESEQGSQPPPPPSPPPTRCVKGYTPAPPKPSWPPRSK